MFYFEKARSLLVHGCYPWFAFMNLMISFALFGVGIAAMCAGDYYRVHIRNIL